MTATAEERSVAFTVEVGGRELKIETGEIARQAGGSVVLTYGDTVLFSSACASKDPLKDIDFLPFRVDYQEKFSSAGKTLSGFIKREGRPNERETLVSRLIDRPLRPLFEDGYCHDIQLLTYVWSYDGENPGDSLAITASAAALCLSDIPLKKPVAGVRVGYVNGEYLINPTSKQMETSRLDLMLAGTEEAILMTEGFADFMTEEEMLEAVRLGHEAIAKICKAMGAFAKEHGKAKNLSTLQVLPEEVERLVAESCADPIKEAMTIIGKSERDERISVIKEELMNRLFPEDEEPAHKELDVKMAFKKLQARIMRNRVLETGVRADGRKADEVRQIWGRHGLLPRTHGSALFTRGETQAMAVCTLGGDNMAQRYEDLDTDSKRRFYLQYFFPPFSVGEVGRMGPAGRREVGHGKLAERALSYSVPSKESFPYVVRVESNITESNGSSSMASVCGGCLAMMDAGVPIKAPVAGIAMGLILEEDQHCVLSDILGLEDALGDMDFKVAGSKEGITAFQLDIKVEGITQEIMADALAQAKEGRLHILGEMIKICAEPNKELSKHAPRIETMQVKPSKIGAIIGPGGKQIRAIVEETGVDIDIDDSGLVSIASSTAEGMAKAKAIIEGITGEIEIGRIYDGKIVSVVPFGAFVQIVPGTEGLCHISQLRPERIKDINEVVKQGDALRVKVVDINERGQLKLSHTATLEKVES